MRTAMDAVIREECEVSVISRDELLEIRQDIRELRADNRRLAEKIDAVARSLIDKIDVLRIALREKMDEDSVLLIRRSNRCGRRLTNYFASWTPRSRCCVVKYRRDCGVEGVHRGSACLSGRHRVGIHSRINVSRQRAVPRSTRPAASFLPPPQAAHDSTSARPAHPAARVRRGRRRGGC